LESEARVQILTPEILNDTQVAIPVLNRGFDDGPLAKIIPGDNLDASRGIGHRASEGLLKRRSVLIIQIAKRRLNSRLRINVMETRESATDKSRPSGGLLIEAGKITGHR